MRNDQQLDDADLIGRLEKLRQIPPRDPERLARQREIFLAEAQKMVPPVSAENKMRHTGWMQEHQKTVPLHRKERPVMLTTIVSIILALSLALGGAGATVVAAQSSQPDDPLYGLKTWSEDVRLDLAADPETKMYLALQFAQRRGEEIEGMVAAGETPPEPVMTRLQSQTELAVQLAAGLPGEQAVQAWKMIQTRMEEQLQFMEQARASQANESSNALVRAQEVLRERIRVAEANLETPIQNQQQNNQPENAGPQEPAGPAQNADQNAEQNTEQNAGQGTEPNAEQNMEQNGSGPVVQPPAGSPQGPGNINGSGQGQQPGFGPMGTPTPMPGQCPPGGNCQGQQAPGGNGKGNN